MKSSKSPLTEGFDVPEDVAIIAVRRVSVKAVLDALDFADKESPFFNTDHYDALRVVDEPPVAVAVNVHGLTPPVQTFRLFDLGGWRLLVEVDSDDDGEGIGVRYTLHVSEGVRMSVWYGTTDNDEYDEAHPTHVASVTNMTNVDAAAMLSTMLGQAVSFIRGGGDDT